MTIQSCLWAMLAAVGSGGEILAVSCTDELRPNLVVEVRDAMTGAPAALGATGVASIGGAKTELSSVFHSLTLQGSWGRERSGTYDITVRKPGFKPAFTSAEVDEDQCHVKTRRVQVRLTPEPISVVVQPFKFRVGERVRGFGPSAGIRTFGDTLEIVGRAMAPCSEVTVIATRVNYFWHIQLQPKDWASFGCTDQTPLQQFEVRYLMPRETQSITITNGLGCPVLLFEGSV